MRRLRYTPCFLLLAILGSAASGQDETRTAPDQRYGIAFASFAPLNTDIFVAASDGSDPKPLLPHPDLDYNASFSADGRWIVFTSMRNGSADIYRVHTDGSGLERLTNDPAFDDQGALSPDGRSLAFVSNRNGQANIWTLELSTGSTHNVSSDPAGDFRPSWSPDGQWIAFSSDRASKKPIFGFATGHFTEIYVMRPDGSGLRQVTHLDAFVGSPAWSADGTRLVYYEAIGAEVANITSPLRRRGTTQVVSIDLATSERQVLTTGAGEKWSPHWLADGRIGYASGGPERRGRVRVRCRPGRAARCGAQAGRPMAGAWCSTVTSKAAGLRFANGLAVIRCFASCAPASSPRILPSGERLVVNDETGGDPPQQRPRDERRRIASLDPVR